MVLHALHFGPVLPKELRVHCVEPLVRHIHFGEQRREHCHCSWPTEDEGLVVQGARPLAAPCVDRAVMCALSCAEKHPLHVDRGEPVAVVVVEQHQVVVPALRLGHVGSSLRKALQHLHHADNVPADFALCFVREGLELVEPVPRLGLHRWHLDVLHLARHVHVNTVCARTPEDARDRGGIGGLRAGPHPVTTVVRLADLVAHGQDVDKDINAHTFLHKGADCTLGLGADDQAVLQSRDQEGHPHLFVAGWAGPLRHLPRLHERDRRALWGRAGWLQCRMAASQN
mmetsp:Transcript_97374/g.258669  ORF Transcript_97374/g.258669 Transcript_97374/m.258669 type:complete len:285 (+) Transcript_97374:330-1184(+)